MAGLTSVLGGVVAPFEKASYIHERPVLNWLWATGCHPFGPFSNHSGISQLMADNALVILMFIQTCMLCLWCFFVLFFVS